MLRYPANLAWYYKLDRLFFGNKSVSDAFFLLVIATLTKPEPKTLDLFVSLQCFIRK